MRKIEVTQGDITIQAVDAIVNAANEQLMGGGGVDGAIHRAAGPELLEACRRFPEVRDNVRCPTGQARITPGYLLAAKYVIHTVGPVYRGGVDGEPHFLRACYENSMRIASEHRLKSVAFPAISCGVYCYPINEAAMIAVNTVFEILQSPTSVESVLFVCFSQDTYQAFSAQIKSIRTETK